LNRSQPGRDATLLLVFAFAAGVASIVVGVALIYPPAAWIVAGLAAATAALLVDAGERR
jgi:hypothetical protein